MVNYKKDDIYQEVLDEKDVKIEDITFHIYTLIKEEMKVHGDQDTYTIAFPFGLYNPDWVAEAIDKDWDSHWDVECTNSGEFFNELEYDFTDKKLTIKLKDPK